MFIKKFLVFLFVIACYTMSAQSSLESKRSKFIKNTNKAYAENFENSYFSIEGNDILVLTQSVKDVLRADGYELNELNIKAMSRIFKTPSSLDQYCQNNLDAIRAHKGMMKIYSELGFRYFKFRGVAQGKLYASSVYSLR